MRLGPLGIPEIAILLLVVLLIFGYKRFPNIASSLGKGFRNFKSGLMNETEDEQP